MLQTELVSSLAGYWLAIWWHGEEAWVECKVVRLEQSLSRANGGEIVLLKGMSLCHILLQIQQPHSLTCYRLGYLGGRVSATQ